MKKPPQPRGGSLKVLQVGVRNVVFDVVPRQISVDDRIYLWRDGFFHFMLIHKITSGIGFPEDEKQFEEANDEQNHT